MFVRGIVCRAGLKDPVEDGGVEGFCCFGLLESLGVRWDGEMGKEGREGGRVSMPYCGSEGEGTQQAGRVG